MPLFFSSVFLSLTLTVSGCVDNVLWQDSYGWTCRDYERDPLECASTLAVSVGGIDAYEACCACQRNTERRRDYSNCITQCTADENVCEAECASDKNSCESDCPADEEDPGGVGELVTPTSELASSNSSTMDPVAIVVIVLGILLLFCIICLLLYFLCMTQPEGTCQDEEFTQQPMLDCDNTCDAPCGEPCGGGAAGQPYGQQRYPQEQGW